MKPVGSEKTIVAGSAFLLVVLPLALMFQGMDMTDTGWVLASNQNFFSAPESVSYWFHLWFGNFLGGIWYHLFGSWGLLSFRFAAVLIFWLTAFLTHRVFGDLVRPSLLFTALLMGMVFHFGGKITIIHYNNVGTLFLILGAFLLLRWVRTEKARELAFSGAVFSLAAFTRLPNLAAVLFGLVVVLAGRLQGRRGRAILRDLRVFFGGFLLAAVLVLLLMKSLGHLGLYVQAVKELFSGSAEELSHYGSNTMEKKFFVDLGRAIFAAFSGLLLLHVFRKVLTRFGGARILGAGAALITILAVALSWRFLYGEAMPVVYLGVGLSFITTAILLLLPDTDRGFTKSAAASSAIILLVLTVGSDTGMKVASYGLIFAFPLVLRFWLDGPDIRAFLRQESFQTDAQDSGLSLERSDRRGIFILLLLLYAGFSVPFLYRGTYRDSSLRHKMAYSIEHPLLRGILTTEARARAVSEALRELDNRVQPGDELLAFESIPMIHFLTRTRPYLHNSWPMLYLPSEFERNLKKAESREVPLPPVILARTQTRSGSWPNSGAVSRTETAVRDRAILEGFLQKHRYREVWENGAFRILMPDM